MRIVKNIIIGGIVILFGFIIYPPFIDYIYTPLYDLAKVLYPSLPPEQDIFWRVFPFVLLFAIIGCGVMWIIGKKSWGGEGEDTTSSDAGGQR